MVIIGAQIDTTPPIITIIKPVGDVTIIPPATYAVVNVEVSTDEPAHCWYEIHQPEITEHKNLNSDSDRKVHSDEPTELIAGGDYTYSFICKDDTGNPATKDSKFS